MNSINLIRKRVQRPLFNRESVLYVKQKEFFFCSHKECFDRNVMTDEDDPLLNNNLTKVII